MKFKFNLIWLFALTGVAAIVLAFHLRSRSVLNDFLPPATLSTFSLEYEWGPYAEIIAFSADMPLAEIDQWYANNFNIHIRDAPAVGPGELTIYFYADSQGREVSVCLADMSVQTAVDNLTSYVGSDKLQELVNSKPAIVGVLFMKDLDETYRNFEEAGEQ